MSATVDFGRWRAIIRNKRWRLVGTSRDRKTGSLMVELLNGSLPAEEHWIPDYDYWCAEDAARRLGGEIIQADKLPDYDPDVYY